jgi:hypothetical protein
MITSGLVNQKRARFDNGFIHQRDVNARDTTIRPYQSGVDMPIVDKSSYASPSPTEFTKQGTRVKTQAQVFYNDIFGKNVTPTQRIYLFNMLQRLTRGGGGLGGGGTAPTPGPGGMGGGGRPTGMPTDTVTQPPTTLPDGATPPPSLMGGTESFYTASDQESFGMADDFVNSADNVEDELKAEDVVSDTFYKPFNLDLISVDTSDVESEYERLKAEIETEKQAMDDEAAKIAERYKALRHKSSLKIEEDQSAAEFLEWYSKQKVRMTQQEDNEKRLRELVELQARIKQNTTMAGEGPSGVGRPRSFSSASTSKQDSAVGSFSTASMTSSAKKLFNSRAEAILEDRAARVFDLKELMDIPDEPRPPSPITISSKSSSTGYSNSSASLRGAQKQFGVWTPPQNLVENLGITPANLQKTINVNGVGPLKKPKAQNKPARKTMLVKKQVAREYLAPKITDRKGKGKEKDANPPRNVKKKDAKKNADDASYEPSGTPSDDSRKGRRKK